jgi:hypothetical protein
LITPSLASAQTRKKARIIVSLADNANQGIVPIKASLGNGQDAKNNLYWGALYGAKTYFKRMESWTVRQKDIQAGDILDAFALTHVAFPDSEISFEAWDGAAQKNSVKAYLSELRESDSENELVGFIGHNALMDLFVANLPVTKAAQRRNLERQRKGIVIACNSAPYFEPHHRAIGIESYVMTRGLMAPEAYVLEGILLAWLKNQTSQASRLEAAKKYAEYQKIPLRAAKRLFGVKL